MFPIQIQADKSHADDSSAEVMLHVFDSRSFRNVCDTLSRYYLHVIAWDSNGNVVYQYDNR